LPYAGQDSSWQFPTRQDKINAIKVSPGRELKPVKSCLVLVGMQYKGEVE